MDNEDDIRRPDKVKREILFDDTRSDFERQLDEALYISLQELHLLTFQTPIFTA